jgi:CBS domain-containing protein
MTADVAACRPDSNLAEVVTTMWHRDCGSLPVVGPDGHVAGMITDRDIAIAVATKGRTADRIEVREVMTGYVFGCAPEDSIQKALDTMRVRKVRRLPVVDDQGHLKGIVSFNDIVLHTSGKREAAASPVDVLEAMQGICTPEPLVSMSGVA